jgi:hypothetical protein
LIWKWLLIYEIGNLTATDLSALLVYLIDGLDCIQMINTRIESNLIHYNYASFLHFAIKFPNFGRDVTGGDDVGLAFDCRLNNDSMECEWNEGDDKIVSSNLSVKVRNNGDVKRDCSRVRQSRCDLLGTLECAGSLKYVLMRRDDT